MSNLAVLGADRPVGLMRRRRFPPRAAADATPAVPAVLPLVVFEAHGDRLVVTVNGDKLAAAPIHRDEIGRVLTELVTKFGAPTRVELHEQDGTVHADIVPPPPPEPEPEEETVEEQPMRRRRHRAPVLVEVHAEGFVAGEDVAVTVVLRHGSAGPGGHVRALIDRTEIPSPDTAEIALVGRISGTTSFQPLT